MYIEQKIGDMKNELTSSIFYKGNRPILLFKGMPFPVFKQYFKRKNLALMLSRTYEERVDCEQAKAADLKIDGIIKSKALNKTTTSKTDHKASNKLLYSNLPDKKIQIRQMVINFNKLSFKSFSA